MKRLFSYASLICLFLAACQDAGSPVDQDAGAAEARMSESIQAGNRIIVDRGTIRFISLEGGFYVIKTGRHTFDPLKLPDAFKADGLNVWFVARTRNDLVSFHMIGTIVELLDIVILPDPGEEFTLPLGYTAMVGKIGSWRTMSVTFEEVVSDSRCPIGALCIQAGEAVIRAHVTVNCLDLGSYTMRTRALPAKRRFGPYTLLFTGLEPYPAIGKPIDKKNYEASFVVLKERR